jgi:membrane protein YdbS with pleckstrin-like domain
MGFPKRLLGEDETLVLELRPHAKRLVGPALVLLVTAPAATYLAGRIPAEGGLVGWVRWAVAVAAALVVLRWSVWPFLVWWNTVYVITDRRLVMRQGVISRRGHDMPLTRLNDVTFSHSLLDRMLGCGDLVVESAGERGQVVLQDIPQVEKVQRTLYRLGDDARGGYGGGPHADDGTGSTWPSARPLLDDGSDGDGDSAAEHGGEDGDGGGRRRWFGRRRR